MQLNWGLVANNYEACLEATQAGYEYSLTSSHPGRYSELWEDAMSQYDLDYENEDEPEIWDDGDGDGDHDRIQFADPGGNSALRAASRSNPRDQVCPTCGEDNRLTREDVALGYQCDSCADATERGGW